MNMIDYIGWRGDITFREKGINDIDNLIFSELAYTDMKSFYKADDDFSMTVAEIYDAYTRNGIDQSKLMNDPLPVLRKASASERFKNVRVYWYSDVTDADMLTQFAAVTFLYREGEAYVAFRGTDNTVIGWRECFNMSYLSETPGQNKAVEYLNKVGGLFDGTLYVGGHSKGGNFAVYASAFCKNVIKDRIVRVYSNDGPGFLSEVSESEDYLNIVDRIRKIVPESSLVGNLLDDKVKNNYITSSAKGFVQHDPYTWNVYGTRFEASQKQDNASVFMKDTLSRWLSSLNDENKKIFVDAVFGTLDEAGVKSLSELGENRFATVITLLKSASKIDPDNKTDMQNTVKMLVKAGREVAKSGKKNSK